MNKRIEDKIREQRALEVMTMNRVMEMFDDEEVYYTWLEYYPDGETELDAIEDFGDLKHFEEIRDFYHKLFKAYIEDGLVQTSEASRIIRYVINTCKVLNVPKFRVYDTRTNSWITYHVE